MNRIINFILIILFFFSCNTHSDKSNSKIEEQVKLKPGDSISILINGSDFKTGIIKNIDGIEYTSCYSKDGKIIYLQTTDSIFQAPEGIKVGDKYSDIEKTCSCKSILEPGWACYFPLASGWNAAFSISYEKNNQMKMDSSVSWFFKRNSELELK